MRAKFGLSRPKWKLGRGVGPGISETRPETLCRAQAERFHRLNHDAENVVVCLRRATSDKHDLLYYFEIDQLVP